MPNPTFYIVDVFAERRYAGNQLAVVRGAADFTDDEMQAVALEMNYSETTFIVSEKELDRVGRCDVRIFTPEHEVPFAGHPTLGTAYVIQQEIVGRSVEHITLNLEAGKIPVTFGDVLWMQQLPPTFGETLSLRRMSNVLGLEEADLDGRYPIQEVSTGLPAIVVPLKNLDALKRCRVDRGRYFELVESRQAKNVYVFCPEAHEGADLATRMFADYHGVPEDPATGSAAGCLAGYLVEHRYFDTDSIDIRVEQGYEIGRPSLLYLRAERREGEISVSIGGKVQMVARGELL